MSCKIIRTVILNVADFLRFCLIWLRLIISFQVCRFKLPIKYCFQRLVYFRAAHICFELRYLFYSSLKILFVVFHTLTFKKHRVVAAIAADIKSTVCWKTLDKKHQSLPREIDSWVHRSTAVYQEYVFLFWILLSLFLHTINYLLCALNVV